MITIVIKKLRYLPTSSSLICPAVISNSFPLNLVPMWIVILLAVLEVHFYACSPDITSKWFYIWKCFPNLIEFLSAFAKLRKATISFVMSLRLSFRPSFCMRQLCSQWMDFHEIWYWSIFRKFVTKIQVSLKSDKNDGYFTWKPICIFDHISLSSS
jgi:hypothetical protein